jgi:hypothetical protein
MANKETVKREGIASTIEPVTEKSVNRTVQKCTNTFVSGNNEISQYLTDDHDEVKICHGATYEAAVSRNHAVRSLEASSDTKVFINDGWANNERYQHGI